VLQLCGAGDGFVWIPDDPGVKGNFIYMYKSFKKIIITLFIASLFVIPMAGVQGGVQTAASSSTTLYLPLAMNCFPFLPLVNGNFESGSGVGWTEFSTHGYTLIINSGFPGTIKPHGGSWAAWLGGAYSEINYVQQQVTVPCGAPYLDYYRRIASTDPTCGHDFASVLINGSPVDTYNLCNTTNTSGWVPHTVDLSAYVGRTVMLQIRAETDGIINTNSNLFVDDVTFQTTAAASVQSSGGAQNLDNLDSSPRSGSLP
jgi:hypothetical protein